MTHTKGDRLYENDSANWEDVPSTNYALCAMEPDIGEGDRIAAIIRLK